MNPTTGLILRLLGPLIEVGCLIALFQTNPRSWSLAGVSGEVVLFVVFGIGFVLVILGNFFVRKPPRTRPKDEAL